MCGVIGMVASSAVNLNLYDGLTVLQHRGQDAAGIMTCQNRKIHLRKGNGLVKDVFHNRHMRRLLGNTGIGHVRYPTAGCASSAEAQPFFVNSPYGIGLAHNGNLTNSKQLKKEMFETDLRHINTESDSEVLLNILAHELQQSGKIKLEKQAIFTAIAKLNQRCEGGYASVALIPSVGLIGFRDNNGIRPLCIGKRETNQGTDYMIASESVALDISGFTLIDDIKPGEAVFISENGELHRHQCTKPELSPCLFEYVYLARPDSILDNVHVHKSRLRMGQKLATKIKQEWPDIEIDVVMPIPDTSRTSALELAYSLGVIYREGFIKNRYIGRTFIMPGQENRKKSVRQKLNPLKIEFKGKNVLLVDDSIVRGTTSAQIVELARKSGAKKVYFASTSPKVKYPNVYGIDMPSAKELVSHGRSTEEIAEIIGADKLIFQNLEDLKETVTYGNKEITQFDTSVFDGNYITGNIDENYLNKLEQERCILETETEETTTYDAELGVHNND